MSACLTCESEIRDELEAAGVEALAGNRSWRSIAAEFGLNNPLGVQNHMRVHYVAPLTPEERATEAVPELVAQTIEELTQQIRMAPVEVKPFYLIAIQNLRALDRTQPSQQHLINALKAITEVTGMKMEQRMMLQYGQAMFGPRPAPRELEDGIIDAEVV